MLPKTFKARGVDDPELLPNYPYRDDALLYWDAIHRWVSSYLSLYYHSDADVQADPELAAWFDELVRPTAAGSSGSAGRGRPAPATTWPTPRPWSSSPPASSTRRSTSRSTT